MVVQRWTAGGGGFDLGEVDGGDRLGLGSGVGGHQAGGVDVAVACAEESGGVGVAVGDTGVVQDFVQQGVGVLGLEVAVGAVGMQVECGLAGAFGPLAAGQGDRSLMVGLMDEVDGDVELVVRHGQQELVVDVCVQRLVEVVLQVRQVCVLRVGLGGETLAERDRKGHRDVADPLAVACLDPADGHGDLGGGAGELSFRTAREGIDRGIVDLGDDIGGPGLYPLRAPLVGELVGRGVERLGELRHERPCPGVGGRLEECGVYVG